MELNLANDDWEDNLGTNWYRCMLDNIKKGEEVASFSMKQCGVIEKIIRNIKGIPVCVQVRTSEGETDYISVDRISDWDGSGYFMNADEYSDWMWKTNWEGLPEDEEDDEDWYGDDWKDADRWDKSPAEEAIA